MEHEHILETLPLYAVGALDRAERQSIDTHLLTGCPVCHAELKAYQALCATFPYVLSPCLPPSSLKTDVLAACRSSPPKPEIQKKPLHPSLEPGEWMKHLFPPTPKFPIWAPTVFGIIASLFVLSLLYMGYAAYVRTTVDNRLVSDFREDARRAKEQVAKLEATVRHQETTMNEWRAAESVRHQLANELRETVILREAELDDLRHQMETLGRRSAAFDRSQAQDADMVRLLRSPTVKVIPLHGTEAGDQAGGMALYESSSGKALFYLYNMPWPPPGSEYHVWTLDGSTQHVGTLTVDHGRTARLLVRNLPALSSATTLTVTLETARMPTQPTGAALITGTW